MSTRSTCASSAVEGWGVCEYINVLEEVAATLWYKLSTFSSHPLVDVKIFRRSIFCRNSKRKSYRPLDSSAGRCDVLLAQIRSRDVGFIEPAGNSRVEEVFRDDAA